MPILEREPSCYPDDLLNGFCRTASDRQWWALYTKARHEKAVARYLAANSIPFYLPLVPQTSVSCHRRRTSHVPLFSGYVFVCARCDERTTVLMSNRISRILDVGDDELLEMDLRQLSQLIVSGAPLTIEARLGPGQRVRVRYGPLAGLEGTVLKRRDESRLLIGVSFLQQGASVEIEDFQVELIE